jgi:hypothetical protein
MIMYEIHDTYGNLEPEVLHFVDHDNRYSKPWKLLEKHPDYDAATNHNDHEAAKSLLDDVFTAENEERAKILAPEPEGNDLADHHRTVLMHMSSEMSEAILSDAPVLVVPVRTQDKNNCLPAAFAEYMAKDIDAYGADGDFIRVDKNIVQSNEVPQNQNKNVWHDMAFRPKFEGAVEKDGRYILVDPVCTTGSTFNELRRHIEKGGGEVVATMALSLGGHGDELTMRPEMKQALTDKFGKENLGGFMQRNGLYGGDLDYMTQAEAKALKKLPSLEKADELIAEARARGRENVNEQQQTKTQSKQRGGLEW